MAKVINFNKGEEVQEESYCPLCEIAGDYLGAVLDAESEEELFGILHNIAEEAMQLGERKILVSQIGSALKYLDHIDGVCDEECDYCEE